MVLREAILLARFKSFQMSPREIKGLVYELKAPNRFTTKKIAVRQKRWTYDGQNTYTIGLQKSIKVSVKNQEQFTRISNLRISIQQVYNAPEGSDSGV